MSGGCAREPYFYAALASVISFSDKRVAPATFLPTRIPLHGTRAWRIPPRYRVKHCQHLEHVGYHFLERERDVRDRLGVRRALGAC
jgi:hypothetical protein